MDTRASSSIVIKFASTFASTLFSTVFRAVRCFTPLLRVTRNTRSTASDSSGDERNPHSGTIGGEATVRTGSHWRSSQAINRKGGLAERPPNSNVTIDRFGILRRSKVRELLETTRRNGPAVWTKRPFLPTKSGIYRISQNVRLRLGRSPKPNETGRYRTNSLFESYQCMYVW